LTILDKLRVIIYYRINSIDINCKKFKIAKAKIYTQREIEGFGVAAA